MTEAEGRGLRRVGWDGNLLMNSPGLRGFSSTPRTGVQFPAPRGAAPTFL